MLLAAIVVSTLTVPVAAQATAPCGPGGEAALQRALHDIAAGEYEAALAGLQRAVAAPPACAELTVAASSWEAWLAAARAGQVGGTPESLAPVETVLAALESHGRSPDPQAAYVAAVIHAAAAAAQDERAEMRVWLEHANDLWRRRVPEQRGWPLSYDLAEGELWLAAEDYDLAEAAFARAITSDETAAAFRGLARTRARRGDLSGACGPFARALALVAADRPTGTVAVEARAFLALCK